MDKASLLHKLYQELEENALTLPLTTQARDIIPGEGDPDAKIMLIGEAPGFHEHQQRRPFVGRSGQLLRTTLTQVGFPPETVYISNIVKVRPPENRDPTPQEIAAFKPYLDREILTINPLLIVTLGRFSMGKFLPDVKISQVHGRLHRVKWNSHVCYILPMYHPAAALRSAQMKLSFVSDFEKIPKILSWVEEQQETVALEADVADALL